MSSKVEEMSNDTGNEELTITRVFNAPIELMWKVWTDPEHLRHWWGPKGFKMITHKLDLKPGGMYHYRMQSPAVDEMWGKFVYWDIAEPERLEFIVSFSDKKGNITRHPMGDTWPLEVMNILTFTEETGKTTVTLKGFPIRATEEEIITFTQAHKSVKQGFKGTMDQLEDYLARII